jgi:Sec-independent protein translocase protein TatA
MISFGQFLILLLVVLLLFADVRQIFNKAILFIVNIKNLIKKKSFTEKEKKD